MAAPGVRWPSWPRAAVVVAALGLIAWFAAGGRPDGFGPAPPTAHPADAVWATIDVAVDVEGRMADLLQAEAVSWERNLPTGRVGDGQVVGFQLALRAAHGPVALSPVTWPGPGDASPWTVDPVTDVGVLLFAGHDEVVAAAADPDLVGLELPHDRVVPGVPRVAGLQVAIPELAAGPTTVTLPVPLGEGGVLRVTVRTTPDVGPLPGRPSPATDTAGTLLDVPGEGTAAPAWIGDGHPVWVTHTAAHGVAVVDARTRPDGPLTELVGWCQRTGELGITAGHLVFDADGTAVQSWGPPGLTTYAHEPAGQGRVRLTGASRAGAAGPGQTLEWVGGQDGYRQSSGDVPREAPCAPSAPDQGDAIQPLPLDALPSAEVGLLPATRSPSLVEGHLRIASDGTGCLSSEVTADGGCAGEEVPVRIDGLGMPGEPASWRLDGEVVVAAMAEGVVTELWSVPGSPLEWVPDESSVAVRVGEVERVDPSSAACGSGVEVSPVDVGLRDLRLVTGDGPVSLQDWDGVLPPGWILLAEDDELVGGPGLVTVDPPAAEDLRPGDLVVVQERWWEGRSVLTRLDP